MLDIVLCDDDAAHNGLLHSIIVPLIRKHQWPARIALEGTSADEILTYAALRHGRALYMLDLDLGEGMDGLALALEIRKRDVASYLVYVSAHREYLLNCYKTKASDFLLKPITSEQVEQCLVSVFRDMEIDQSERILSISIGSQDYLLAHAHIYCFEKQREYVVAYHTYGQLRWRESYDTLMKRLHSDAFMRVHKGYIVNVRHILNYSNSKRLLEVDGGMKLPVSRRHANALLRQLDGVMHDE